MARAFTCGFETGAMALEACYSTGADDINTAIKRSGSYAARLGAGNSCTYVLSSGSIGTNTWYTRVWMYIEAWTSGSGAPILQLPGVFFRTAVLDSTTVDVMDGTTANLFTTLSSSVFPVGRWFSLETEANAGAAGNRTFGIKIDGVELFRTTTATASDTTPQIVLYCPVGGSNWYWDDIAANDSTGSAPHNTAPDVTGRVIHLRPNGDGDADTGSPTRGGTDSGTIWGQVDDVTPNAATDYAILPTNPSEIVVAIDDATSLIGASDTVLFVEVHASVAGASGTTTNWFPGIMSQSAGTKVYASAVTLASALWNTNDDTAGSRQCKLRQLIDPQAGGAWTRALLDSTQIIARTTDGNPDVYVTALWALVEYVPAPVLPPPMRVINHRALSRAANF
jgi:hypothetical protein